jgi:hypothetical protein
MHLPTDHRGGIAEVQPRSTVWIPYRGRASATALTAVANQERQARRHSINGYDGALSTVLGHVSDGLTIVHGNEVFRVDLIERQRR